MSELPTVDVNLFVYNGQHTIGPAIESVLAQTWPAIVLTIIDDGSTDQTPEIIAGFARAHPDIRTKNFRTNRGAVASFQHAFACGNADFVMPKSADDMIAPDFVERMMEVLLDNPDCAMCHASGVLFHGEGVVRGRYPELHNLNATGSDPVRRARAVMAHYTSSPSFWGVYRRRMVDRLARIRDRAGWDHALLAELALYGEIRHVPLPLYWRRDGGKPILQLARKATERGGRGLDVDNSMTEPHWRMPMLTTVLAHLETFAVAHITADEREAAWTSAVEIFRARWLDGLQAEAASFRQSLPVLLREAAAQPIMSRTWASRGLYDLLHAGQLILPELDWSEELQAMDALCSYSQPLQGAA